VDEFEWDEEKSERCVHERGFDFAYATQVFESEGAVEWEDKRAVYGEVRYVTVGEVGDAVLAVVWTMRGRTRRIISARLASRRERKVLYANRETHEKRNP
jgi:uncharacterized DUF497 family protein